MHVSFNNVSKSYGRNTIIQSLTESIEPGTLLALIGINGAGKTTILNIVSGICGANKGHVEFDGEVFNRDNVEQRKKLCYLSDFYHLFPYQSILENISIHVKLWDSNRVGLEEKVMHWLEDFDLLEHANSEVETLSRGQLYKASLVAMLAVDPELWVIDEPFASGMDPQGITMFRKYAKEATEKGSTVIYTTQLLDLAERFSDRIWLLDQGELKLNCTPAEVKKHGNLEQLFTKLRDNV